MDLTDAQWAVLEPLFRPKRRADGRGLPWQDTRAVLNGVSTHGCSLARFAVSLSVLSDLSSTLPTLAAQRVVDSLAAKTGHRAPQIRARSRRDAGRACSARLSASVENGTSVRLAP